MNAPAAIRIGLASAQTRSGKYKLTVQDYLLLDETGSFAGVETELVDGSIIVMSPEWRPHFRIKSELFFRIRQAVDQAHLPYFVGTEGSVALSENDMPRPDILLTNAAQGEGAVPRDSVPFLVEVSSTTLDDDLGVKADRYAAGGIAEYWVVDVDGRVIHRLWEPTGSGYANRDAFAFGVTTAAATIAGLVIDTNGL